MALTAILIDLRIERPSLPEVKQKGAKFPNAGVEVTRLY